MNQPTFSRRNFLRSGALLSTISVLGLGQAFGVSAADGDDIPTMLNIAATAETFACTHYYRAITAKIRFTTPQLAYVKAALEEELIHLEYLNANQGKALATSFFFPTGTFNSPSSFATVSAVAETVFVAAYLAAARRFAELGQPLLAATAAQIAVVEGQHLALVRQTAGELPNNIAYGEPQFFNVSDAVAVVQPLLTGQTGGLGPMEKTSVDYPGADKIRALLGKSLVTPVKPFTDPSLTPQATPNATAAATESATQAPSQAPTQSATQAATATS